MAKGNVAKSQSVKNKRKIQKHRPLVEKGRKRRIMSTVLPYIISGVIGALVTFVFFKLSPSKKDLTQINDQLKGMRQDFLSNDDYKKYLELYQILYTSVLESSFPGGYLTFGIRDNSIFNPGSFTNDKIEVDVEGTISFSGKDCDVSIYMKRIYFTETQNSIGNISTTVHIKDYEIGKRYSANTIATAVGWKQYIVILSDDPVNPVFVFGFAK